jgi:hypothetical protein
MQTFGVRWNEFRGFVDTDWLDIKPITLLIGSNNSGKTSLLLPLLLLKQTLTSRDRSLGLLTRGDLIDVGGYRDFVHGHDDGQAVSFGLRFPDIREWTQERWDPKVPKPHRTKFTFSPHEGPRNVQLARYEVFPEAGPRLVLRERLATGQYSLPGFAKRRGRPGSDADAITRAIRDDQPHHFLFTAVAAVNATLNQAVGRLDEALDDDDAEVDVSVPERAIAYIAYVQSVERVARRLLSRLTYIGPLRERPKRFYAISGEEPPNVGVRGEFAPEILFRAQGQETEARVTELLDLFLDRARFRFKAFDDNAFSVFLRRHGSVEANLADTGFGISQILPLLVEAASPTPGLLLTEQPEIHLNPALQTRLADLFVRLANGGHSVIAETHSEHLVLRLRRLIADGYPADNVAIYFVGREGGSSVVRPVPIAEDGHIDSRRWPRGFFEDAFREAIGLASAQRARLQHVGD